MAAPTPRDSASESSSRLALAGRWLVLLGTPLAIAVATWFHPTGVTEVYEDLSPVVDVWLAVHYLYLPLFGLLAVALYLLLAGYRSRPATVGRAGVATFAVFYLAMEAVAGIATGILVREGQALPVGRQEGVAVVVQALFTDPIAGGTASLFGYLGVLGYLVAVVGIAVVLRRDGAPLVPLLLLVGSVVGVAGHAGLQGVLGMALLFVAAAWLEFGWTPARSEGADRRT